MTLKKNPILNLRKIGDFGNTKEVVDFLNQVDNKFQNDFPKLIQLIRTERHGPVFDNALMGIIIINLVTQMEINFKKMAQWIIDEYKINSEELFQNNQISLPLNVLERLSPDDITKGKIIASNFNFQNPQEINHVFSTILKCNFFKAIKEVAGSEISMFDDRAEDILEARKNLYDNWDKLFGIFELRNNLVHTLDTEVNFGVLELENLVSNVELFLALSRSITISYIDPRHDEVDLSREFYSILNKNRTKK